MSDVVSAFQDLVDGEPTLRPLLQDHLEYYDQELLPTLFIAEIVSWVVDHLEDAPEVAHVVIRWMNETYPAASETMKNVIATGGVEAMPSPGQPGCELRDLLSPELQATDPW
ncbi:hypothetical protein [uncultured Friedmanniella sp.]|uniref:DUF7674 family protein n=1 Tax=uncultured Friedmanniella sp. TaxID=335381 RepID=UPI0035CAC849